MTKRYIRHAGTALACTAAFTAIAALPVVSKAASQDIVPADAQAFINFEASPLLPQSAGAKHAALHRGSTSTQRDAIALAGMPKLNYSEITTARTESQQRACMAQAIYYEARSETFAGQKAVGEVIMNRIASKHFPDTVVTSSFKVQSAAQGASFHLHVMAPWTKKSRLNHGPARSASRTMFCPERIIR